MQLIAEQSMWSQRRASHSSASRLFHTPKSSVSGVWAAVFQSLRAHQAESVPGAKYSIGQSVHSATTGFNDRLERGTVDSLWSQTRKHSFKIVCPVFLSILVVTKFGSQAAITSDQSHRLWFRLSWTTDGIHIHSVAVLPVTGSAAGYPLQCGHWYVVTWLYCCRTLLGSPAVPRNERVQSDYTDSWDAWVSNLLKTLS